MSDIRKGDLVMVVRGMPCCGAQTGAEGMVFRVESIGFHPGEQCMSCRSLLPPETAHGCVGRAGIDLPRLKRIPPIEELDRNQIVEELTA